jgi:uncharacterized protein (DUF2384 family)
VKLRAEVVQSKSDDRGAMIDPWYVAATARARAHATSVFGDADYAMQWLHEPSDALGGATPVKLLATAGGDEIVRAELSAIEQGQPV